jgi:thymidylate kinase
MLCIHGLSDSITELLVKRAIKTKNSNLVKKIKNILDPKEKDNQYDQLSRISRVYSHSVPSLLKSLNNAIDILNMAQKVYSNLNTPEMDNLFRCLAALKSNGNLHRKALIFLDIKVVCIEGLEGSGKSTLIDSLVAETGAITIDSLKGISADVQQQFAAESVPEIVTAALALALNYYTIYQIITRSAQIGVEGNKLFIIEEFNHSQIAHYISKNGPTDLKEVSPKAFEWPSNLPLIPFTIFLKASSSCRGERLFKKNETVLERCTSHIPHEGCCALTEGLSMHIYKSIYVYIYMHIYKYVYIYICVYIYAYVYICIYIYIYIYINIYINTCKWIHEH